MSRHVRTDQPVTPVLRRHHPLLRALNFAMCGSAVGASPGGASIAMWNPTRKVLNLGTNFAPAHKASSQGIAPVFTSSSHNFAFNDTPVTGGNTTPWTIAGIFVPSAVQTGVSVIGSVEFPGSSTRDRELLMSSTSGLWEGYLNDGAQKRARSNALPVVGKPDTVIVTTNGAQLICAVKGWPDASTAVSSCGFNGFTSVEFSVGVVNGSLTGMGIALLIHTKSYWNESMRKQFFDNPWQIFAPTGRKQIYGVTSAGGGFFSRYYYDMGQAA